jgi:very-short-patch-repair endonuclease
MKSPKVYKPTAKPRKSPKSKKTKQKLPKYDAFCLLLRQHLGEEVVAEHRFHPTRLWRFDYAIPSHRIAIEIDGGVWIEGRHNRPKGYIADLDKFNNAAALGWRVLKFTPQQQFTMKALRLIQASVKGEE